MEWPILLPVLDRGRIVALPEFLRVYRCNFESSWHRESGRLSGLDHLWLGLQMRGFLVKMALRLSLPARQKIDLVGRSLRNFFVVGLRTVSGEARRLRLAADERRRLILALRAEIDRRRDLLRQRGCEEPPSSWPQDLPADEAPPTPSWRLPRSLEPIRDAVEALATDFFRPRSPRRQAEWRQDLVDSWTLRPLCEQRLEEIVRLTAEAERCQDRLRALEERALG